MTIRSFLRDTLPAWFVFAIALCITALGWYLADAAEQQEAQRRFESHTAAVRANITDRLRAYEQALRGGVSLFYTIPSVTREDWRRYVHHLEIAENYPGIQGMGFAQVVPADARQAHVRAVREQGFPDYRIWPEGERETYTSIVYLEPFDWRNQRAFGYDMLQEPVRREAMERARDTGLPSLSGKVTLMQETNEGVQAGFLLYLPLYRSPSPDAAERREELLGYVYSPFRVGDFMRGLIGREMHPVSLQIFDGVTRTADTLMYDSAPANEAAAVDDRLTATLPFEAGGRMWTLRFSALPALAPDRSTPLAVAAGGMVVSFLLWAIVWSLARNRAQATASNVRLKADIARREEAEEQLREAEMNFRFLFEKNPNPMWVFDRETLSILEVNDAAVAHYGYSHEEFRRLRITDLRPAEDVSRLTAYMERRSPGLRDAGEWRHVKKDGTIIDVEIVSYYLEFRHRPAALVVARDVTESKAAEEALKESEARTRGVLDAALDAYIRINEKGAITEWNPMAERTFGWTRREAVGRALADLIIPAEHRYEHQRGIDRYLVTREGPYLDRRIELPALHRSGRRLPVEITILAVRTPGGIEFSAFLRDLTEVKQAEADLMQAQKMEAIGQLTGGVAHDFNNLLTVIIGNLELVSEKKSGGPALDDTIDDALAAARKGAALTHRLLAFSRKQPLQPERTDLNRIVAGMTSLLRRTLGEDIEIETRLDDDLWTEVADRSQVENALLNLAINARDAMPNGGKLTIETGNATLDADYAARNAEVEPGDYVMLAVTDTGIGMPAEVVARVFEPFFTTKETGAGSGLGLSMIYGFAKQSGGHLKIYSELGHGTTVRLYLPRAKEKQQPEQPAAEAEGVAQGSETILVVEDDDAVRKLVVRNLTQLGYKVLQADDSARAVELLRGDEPMDLLFTDVVLPGGMTGAQLAREARILRPGIQVLFTSGYTQNSIVHQGKLDEGVNLLAKPYRREDLARKIREVLRVRRDVE